MFFRLVLRNFNLEYHGILFVLKKILNDFRIIEVVYELAAGEIFLETLFFVCRSVFGMTIFY